jgi:hypothetical protein
LLSGYVRDPRVGRDVLIGCVVAAGLAVLHTLFYVLPPLVGRPPAQPLFQSLVGALAGGTVGIMFDAAVGGLFAAMFVVLAFVLLRLTLKRVSLAIFVGVVLFVIVQMQALLNSDTSLWITVAYQAIQIAVVTTVVVRYGLLVTAVAAALGARAHLLRLLRLARRAAAVRWNGRWLMALLCLRRRRRRPGILGPRMLGISSAQLFSNLGIRPLPEAPQILRHLHRPAVRREERKANRHATPADTRCLGQAE